ncbi:MAG: hypothetical protein FWF50_07650 [Defluviitaleaceae bacterium]|nr:hypothetical protein [Defluviitaleaceae bacterium]
MEENEFSQLASISPSKKKGIFSFIISKFKRHKKSESVAPKNYYQEIIKSLNKNESFYDNIVSVAELCEKGIKIAREKLITQNKLDILAKELKELSYYENLTSEDVESLKEMLDRYTGLMSDRKNLRTQINSFDKSLSKMKHLEDDAKQVLENVRGAEKKLRYFKHDMFYIESEKSELEYEREGLLFARTFVKRLGIVFVTILGLSSVSLFAFGILMEVDVFLELAIVAVIAILVLPIIYWFSSRVKRELSLNMKKQNLAVSLFNRKKNNYNHYFSFLNFVYNKYGVTSSEKLEKNLKDYEHYKYIIGRYDSIRDLLGKTEIQIDYFIRSNNMVGSSISVDAFSKSVNVEEKRRYFLELKQEQNSLISRFNILQDDFDKINEQINALNDNTNEQVTNTINTYLKEIKQLEDTIPKMESILELEEN